MLWGGKYPLRTIALFAPYRMLVVLITHSGDRYLAVPLCEHIQFLGGVSNHECLIVSPIGTDMNCIENVLRNAFGVVYTHVYHPTMKDWPFGANEAASEAMLHVWQNPALKYHYLMLEPDCVPRDKYWLDRIDSDYRRNATPMLGVRIATREIATGNQVGTHTVGVAVYPKVFPQLCPLVRGLVDMTRGYQQQNALPAPWDAYFGPYSSKMTSQTTLIQHLARVGKRTDAGLQWDCPSLENALSQVKPEAVLIHGSKDPEFLRSITGRKPHAAETRQSPNRVEHQGDAPREAVRESQSQPREENGGQNGSGGSTERQPEKVLTGQDKRDLKTRERHYKEAMKLREELGVDALPATPEWDRMRYLVFNMPWPKLRAYASKLGCNGFGKGNSKGNIINRVIAKEKAQRKEPWTKDLPEQGSRDQGTPHQTGSSNGPTAPEPGIQPQEPSGKFIPVEDAPPVPVGSLPVSNAALVTAKAGPWIPADAQGNPINPPNQPTSPGSKFSPEMTAKMLHLRASRAQLLEGAPSAA